MLSATSASADELLRDESGQPASVASLPAGTVISLPPSWGGVRVELAAPRWLFSREDVRAAAEIMLERDRARARYESCDTALQQSRAREAPRGFGWRWGVTGAAVVAAFILGAVAL